MINEYEFDVKCGQLFAKWRTEAGLTQEYVAKKLDVSRRTYISIENGTTHPKFITVFRIAEITGHSEETAIHDIKGMNIDRASMLSNKMKTFSEDMIKASYQIFFGHHGSNLRALLHLLVAYSQCPLSDRQNITALILNCYNTAVAMGKESDRDGFHPDISLISHAQTKGHEATIKGEEQYKIEGEIYSR